MMTLTLMSANHSVSTPTGGSSTTDSIMFGIDNLPYNKYSTPRWIVQNFCDDFHFFHLSPKIIDDCLTKICGTTDLERLHPFSPIEAIESLGEDTYRSNIKSVVELND